MSTIIRATDRNRGTHGVAFNLDDMATRANRCLDAVRADAAKIVQQAQQQSAAIHKQAEREGRQAAMQAVDQLVQKQLTSVLSALQKAAADLQQAKQAWLTQWEAGAVRLSAAIAQRLIRRELQSHPEITLTLVREALELAAGNAELQIHLNPRDHAVLGSQVDLLVKSLSGMAQVQVVPDEEITKGGCRVDTTFGTIDQQFEAQLKRIEEELT
jgi:flagellar assembly protein FliH